MDHKDFKEYKLIQSVYGDKCAKRSGVLLMNHIDEGIEILKAVHAPETAIRAFCLHPVLQDDGALKQNRGLIQGQNPEIVMLAMEYRKTANAYLSKREIQAVDDIDLSPLAEVNQMLIADKVQNFKDFMGYHYGTHPRSDALFEYFENWFDRLDIPKKLFQELQDHPTELPVSMVKDLYAPKKSQKPAPKR